MLFLLRKIRRKLISTDNKVVTYLLYAIGEIVLVVVGILIAVSIDSWKQERTNKDLGETYTKRLIEDIKGDTTNINHRIAFFNKVYGFGEEALLHIESKKQRDVVEQWQFVLSLFHASQIWPFTAAPTSYTEIQNAGLFKYVGDATLTNSLSYYYLNGTDQLTQLNGGTQEYRDLVRGNIPLNLQKVIWQNCFQGGALVTNLDFRECDFPIGLEAEISSAYYFFKENSSLKRHLTRHLSTITVRNSVYQNILSQANELIKSIEGRN